MDYEGFDPYLEMTEFIRKNLTIKLERDGIDLEVKLLLNDSEISKDFVKLPPRYPDDN